MIRRKTSAIPFILIFFFITGCKKKQAPPLTLTLVKELSDYSSGSALAYDKGRIYLVGDDAPTILVLNDSLEVIDSIMIFENTERRIPKIKKADLESATIIKYQDTSTLLLIGSGSLAPTRNSALLINTITKEKKEIRLDTFYQLLKDDRIREINIEGCTAIQGGIVMANRGNKTNPRNYLVFCPANFWKHPTRQAVRLVKVGFNTDTSVFNGVSGLDYSYKSDRLILSVSTENTYNSFSDGAIGKSYLWIIREISSKKRFTAINPHQVIDLDETDERFKGHKIESVCILAETAGQMELLLVADDDTGSSILFKVTLLK